MQPISLFGILIFLIMSIISIAVWKFSVVLAVINLCIALVLAFIYYIFLVSHKNYISDTSKQLRNLTNNDAYSIFDGVIMPLAVLSRNDTSKIVFYNFAFYKMFKDEDCSVNSSIDYYLGGTSVENLLTLPEIKLEFENKKFKVCAKAISDFVVVYFLNETKYLSLKNKYIDTRLCVGFAIFDNKEELRQDATDEQYSKILIGVENILRGWIKGANGIFKKLSDGKYFIAFEEKYIRSFIADKFKIIDKIHSVKLDQRRWATVSIGISRGTENLSDAVNHANSAVNMSLGRGGDQVSIKTKNSYEFFGGNSQTIEKRSKVRTRIVASAILEKIESSDKVFIMGHKYSDFDSVGAAAAMWSVCARLKQKNAYVVINKEETMAGLAVNHLEKFSSDTMFIPPSQAQTLITPDSLLIIVDTHSVNFLESSDLYTLSKNVIVIDHHRMAVNKIDNSIIFFHEPFASSTCEMVTELIQYMGDKCLKKSEAECLLAGIMLDTKNFSLKSGVRTFEAAAYLKKIGADSREVKKMFVNSIESYKLKYSIINSAYTVENCVLARLDHASNNSKTVCAQVADELLSIRDVKASFVFFESSGKLNICARSLGEVNVQVMMEALGGGGHQTMAAAQIENITFKEAQEKLIEIIKEKFRDSNIEMGSNQ